MCGIYCCVSPCKTENDSCHNCRVNIEEWKLCKDLISARGPDKMIENVESLTSEWCGHFVGSVLWMQGTNLISQPCTDGNGNILLWNGDVFYGTLANGNTCDTLNILNTLKSTDNVLSTLRKVQGPYSFIYYQKSSKHLYFGRDFIGRHSLLVKMNYATDSLLLSSVANKQSKDFIEVPAIGIFIIDLCKSKLNLTCHPWKEPDLRFTDVIEDLEGKINIDIDVTDTIISEIEPVTLQFHPEVKDVEYLDSFEDSVNFNQVMAHLLQDEKVQHRVKHLLELLKNSVEVRIKKKPNFCKNCIKLILNGEIISCKHSKVGILFSGGLDSAILAVIANSYVPEDECIDLINVAFEKPCNANTGKQTNSINYDVPDRKTGRHTFSELQSICPKRKWNFIEVNVTQEELRKHRASRICNLIYPLCTILDESLGCAVWFASRGKGILYQTETEYECPCRILLLGMGADELFGGYMRHRTTLKHKGWDTLTQELNLELSRISERNLGRDDRIVADHGRQSRLPYLDENFIKYVESLKPWERCYPTDKMPAGLGDKLLLRLLARKIGLQETANFPKRAFQFGSRIANGKENAKDISQRL
ncbi:asparagine synthetase domain-containing protein 1 [Cephus cinctus]|uniref:Asparagine synthetase domain-containing protein 1 n=1 Tax=Cephus cinctus TaxID=211228 RepID=A0AAJ7FU74_CEPCN|nr:asparagine synthetase domain-containing protein 1 [Cephus cinctus]